MYLDGDNIYNNNKEENEISVKLTGHHWDDFLMMLGFYYNFIGLSPGV
jgi:hypothetical protein